jgi:hypothetical protein
VRRGLRPDRIVAALGLILLLSIEPVTSAFADDRSIAIGAAQAALADCPKCLVFAVPAESPLVRSHKLFFVSTLDRIPPPFFTVAVSPEGKARLLDANDPKGWNEMLGDERPPLRTDADWVTYVREFLTLAVARAVYVDRLNAAEETKIRKAIGKLPQAGTKIVRGEDRIGLSFYAKDVAGSLQLWNLIASPAGPIIKADLREF